MNPNWYDLLDVDPEATSDEIRTAWRGAVADLDPTDRRFRVLNRAAEVLLDPARRAAYDAELAAAPDDDEHAEQPEPAADPVAKPATDPVADPVAVPVADPVAGPVAVPVAVPVARQAARGSEEPAGRRLAGLRQARVPLVPAWALLVLAGLLAASLVGVGVLLSRPSDAAVESDTEAAQSAAEQAIVPVLSYDARHLDQSQAAAEPYLTASERQQYDKLFAVIRQNAPRTGTVVQAKYLASGIVRSGADQVDVLVFVDQVTRNKQHPKVPVVYKNQVTVTMAKVGGNWLVDNLTTDGQHT